MIKLSGFDFDQTIDPNIFKNTIKSSGYILGASVQKFEQDFAKYNNAPDCASTANCTDALRLCLQAAGVGPGDLVAVPSFTWLSTAEVVKQLNAECLFIDVDASLTVDVKDLDRKLQAHPKTKACIFVDLFGNVANIDAIKQIAERNKTFLIEDAAQATGAKYKGNELYNGHPVCYSFYPTKNLSCWGDAGAVVCNSELAKHIKSLRNHGQNSEKFISNSVGWNSRMDSIQADILLHKLPHLDKWNQRRRSIAKYYQQNISFEHDLQEINPDCEPVYHQYTLITQQAEMLHARLLAKQIQSRIYYSTPIHKLPLYNNGQSLKYTESISGKNICIPVHQYLTDSEVDFIVDTINGK